MPIYEYRCSGCQKTHEFMQKFSDAPLSECPECGGTLTKLMSLSSFALKGSGWYTTDYKRAPSKPNPESKENPTKTSEGDPKPTTTESKSSDASAAQPAAPSASQTPSSTPAPAAS